MFYIFRLALRNVGRNKRRSVLAFLSVAIALSLIVFLQGWRGALLDSMARNYTKSETGHVRIATTEFERKSRFSPVTENVENPAAIIEAIRSDRTLSREISLIAERASFGVLLSNGGSTKAARAFAGDPAVERDLLMFHRSILPGGRYLSNPRECIVGSSIARTLGYGVGDTLRVMTQGADYSLHLRKFVIAGLFQTGMNVIDDAVFQVRLDDARELLAMGETSQQIVIFLRDYRNADRIASVIAAKIKDPSVAVTPWTRIGDTYHLVRLSERIYAWLYLIIGLLGAFIISNIMVMVVIERRREIGILKSLGLKRREILGLFLCEGMLLGLFGSLIGGSIGFAVVLYFHFIPMDMTALMKNMTYPIDNLLYFPASVAELLGAIGLGAALAAVVSLLPSRQAARMNAVEAIKSV